MKPLFLLSFFLLPVYLSNPSKDSAVTQAFQTNAEVLKLTSKKNEIDHYIDTHSKNVIVYVKISENKNLVAVKNDRWPDEVEYTYNIYKNPAGKIIFIAQIPFSVSGDWDIVHKYYFDDQGNTFAFLKQASIFNDDVKGGAVREILLNYYDKKFKNISQVTKLTDKDYRSIKKDKNGYDFPDDQYVIYKNLNECVAAYNIKLTK